MFPESNSKISDKESSDESIAFGIRVNLAPDDFNSRDKESLNLQSDDYEYDTNSISFTNSDDGEEEEKKVESSSLRIKKKTAFFGEVNKKLKIQEVCNCEQRIFCVDDNPFNLMPVVNMITENFGI